MKQETEKAPLARLWHAVRGELRLHSADFWQLALIPFGVALLLGAILLGAILWADDPSAPDVVGVVMSVGCVAAGVMCGLLISGTLFTVYYKLGLQMGQTRRNMILRLSLLSLTEQIALIGFSTVLSAVIVFAYRRFGSDAEWIFTYVPWWGWVLMITLPIALGAFGGSVIMRFGRKGFWVLYAIFMGVILLPQLFGSAVQTQMGMAAEQVANFVVQMPAATCLLSLVPFGIAVVILWKLPIRE